MTRELIRQSDLINQLVLNRTTLEELGRVELLWMYPQSHRVLGFICKSGFLGQQKSAFQLSQIDALGASGVLTQDRPETTTVERVRRLESLLDHEIWSEDGNRIGKIIDCLFQLQTGEITQYLFVSSWTGVLGELYQLSPSQILSFGKQRVLVLATAEFELYQPGLSQKLSQTLSQRAEATTEQAKEQLQQLQELTGQAKVKARHLSQRLSQKAQVLKAQMSETTQTILEQVESGFETLSTHVEEAFEAIDPSSASSHQSNYRASQSVPQTTQADSELEFEHGKARSESGASAFNPASVNLDDDIWGDDWELEAENSGQSAERLNESLSSTHPDAHNSPTHNSSAASRDLRTQVEANPAAPNPAAIDLDDDEPWI